MWLHIRLVSKDTVHSPESVAHGSIISLPKTGSNISNDISSEKKKKKNNNNHGGGGSGGGGEDEEEGEDEDQDEDDKD